jgi:hypothetical protein
MGESVSACALAIYVKINKTFSLTNSLSVPTEEKVRRLLTMTSSVFFLDVKRCLPKQSVDAATVY